jgi:hypothetical protein
MTAGKINGILRLVAIIALLSACSKADGEMPLTRENLLSYRTKLVESQNAITSADREKSKSSVEGSVRLFKATFVKPMEELGYSYDKTVHAYAETVASGKLPQDPETKAQTEGMVMMAKSTGDFAVKNGLISGETKRVLDSIPMK